MTQRASLESLARKCWSRSYRADHRRCYRQVRALGRCSPWRLLFPRPPPVSSPPRFGRASWCSRRCRRNLRKPGTGSAVTRRLGPSRPSPVSRETPNRATFPTSTSQRIWRLAGQDPMQRPRLWRTRASRARCQDPNVESRVMGTFAQDTRPVPSRQKSEIRISKVDMCPLPIQKSVENWDMIHCQMPMAARRAITQFSKQLLLQ
jgi:hypothetical protein